MSDKPNDGDENATTSNEAPTLDQLRASVSKADTDTSASQLAYEQQFKREALKSETQYTHLRGLSDHYYHRNLWSYALMAAMAAMLIFQFALLGFVGAGVWDFSKYSWLLPALLVQNLAQIAALAVLVVKAVFKEMKY